MWSGGLVLACFLIGTSAVADPAVKCTDVCNNGLKGPVHTQKVIFRRLPDYSRLNPQTSFWSPNAWTVFDPSRTLIEQSASLGADGTPLVISRQRKDASGHILESEEISGGHTTTWRNEYVYGPHGPTETREYQGDVLRGLTTETYDEHGNETEACHYNGKGKLLSRSSFRYDDQGRNIEWEIHGSNDELQLHLADTYNRDGDLVSRDFLGPDGRILLSLAFRQGRLVSLWREPDCHIQGLGFVVPEKDFSVGYQVREGCVVQMTVERHLGREGNLESDEMERFDEVGRSLEKLTFRYERDLFGNWTRRDIFAWDPSENAMILIEEDIRLLTYYPN